MNRTRVASRPAPSSEPSPAPEPPTASALRLLSVIRWLLPLALIVLAVGLEWHEHIDLEHEEISAGFVSEIALFALLGPLVVAMTLGWVGRLISAYQSTAAALVDVNRGLEASVADRTRHLSAATEELAATNIGLARANGELRQLDEMKTEFVSLVSHQLRAPLTNINGALELVVQDGARLPPGSQRTLQILAQESQRLSSLIRTILDVSRLEGGRLVPRLGPVAIGPLLARTCASASSAEPGRPLTLNVPDGLPPAWADETLLEEVMRNLLENARHYSPAGTPIDVSARTSDGRLDIEVTDHGHGIPAGEQERIFRSFHRVGNDETMVKGYGLGLYFADKLMRAQGGAIRVVSPAWDDPDAPGARFTFTVPVASDAPEEIEPPAGTKAAAGAA